MRPICAVICAAMVLSTVTPRGGVAQGASTPSTVQLSDSLLAINTAPNVMAARPEAEVFDTTDTAEAHRAAAVDYEVDPFAAVVPYGPGERLEYNVKVPLTAV